MRSRIEPRELIVAALARYAREDAGEFVEEFWEQPASRRPRTGPTRQATHARMQRARALGVAGCLALACEDPKLADAFLDPRLARLRPLSSPVHSRVVHIKDTFGGFTLAGLEAIWSRLLPCYLDLGRRTALLDRDHLLVMHSLQAALSAGLVFAPRAFVDHFRHLFREAGRRGLLDNPHLRMQLAILGSHVDQPGPQVDWLSDPRLRPYDLADTLCFVRRDASPELLEQTAASIRGDSLDPARWSAAVDEAPAAAWLRLADYVRACTRFAGHFSNEGQVLMVLSWVEDIARRRLILRERDGSAAAIRQLCRSLRRIEAVQALEKSRFFRVIDRVPTGPVRERLLQLWHDGYSASDDPECAE